MFWAGVQGLLQTAQGVWVHTGVKAFARYLWRTALLCLLEYLQLPPGPASEPLYLTHAELQQAPSGSKLSGPGAFADAAPSASNTPALARVLLTFKVSVLLSCPPAHIPDHLTSK